MRGSVIAAVTLAILALLILFPGCGNDQAEEAAGYLQVISQIHDGVAWDLGYVLESLSGIPKDDYYHLEELGQLFREAQEIFTSAYREASSLQPLPEAESLQADLLRFYQEGDGKIGEIVGCIDFFQAVLPMLADVQNLALPSLPEGAAVEEIKAAAAEDHRTLDMYLEDLEGAEPPQELQAYLKRLRSFLLSVMEAVVGVEQAVTPEDQQALSLLRGQYAATVETAQLMEYEVAGFLGTVGSCIDALIKEGRGLAVRIQELLGAPTATPPGNW